MRFDDISLRNKRKSIDKLAAVRYLIDTFNANCKKHYSLSERVTIDEMLDAFRGRCGFRKYIPSNPAKYGIKIFALTDAKMFYTNNVEVYCGKQPEGPYICDNSPHKIVKRLVQPISGSGRNITFDNWFTSLPLALDLLENDKLTTVGTIKKNKREIPPFMKEVKNRPVESSIFAFRNNCTLVSYKPKQNKVVLALSTFHIEDDEIEDESISAGHKPKLITFYNDTKSGVDIADEMKCAYSVARITRRWTLRIFFSFLNISGINSYVIYKDNTSHITRKDFLKVLAKELLNDYLRRKVMQICLPTTKKLRINEILGIPQNPPKTTEESRGSALFAVTKKIDPHDSDVKAV